MYKLPQLRLLALFDTGGLCYLYCSVSIYFCIGRFDGDLHKIGDEMRQEKIQKEKLQRERDQLAADKYTIDQDLKVRQTSRFNSK